MKEQQIQKKIITYLEKRGCYVVNGIYTKAGIPDLIGCYKGHFFCIEVKTPTTKYDVSPLQKYNLKRVKDLGGYSTVMWNVEQVEEFLKAIENGNI